MNRGIVSLIILCAACSAHPPARPPVVAPPPAYVAVACVITDDRTHDVLRDALCEIDGQFGTTNGDGYALFERIPTGKRSLRASHDGYQPNTSGEFDLKTNTTVRVALARSIWPRPARSAVLDIKATFISLRDAHGRVMLSWFWPLLDRATQLEWEETWRAAGATHVVLCPVMQYPDYWVAGDDWRGQPDRFAAAVAQILDDGFVPIVFLTSGDGGSERDIETYWAGLLRALADDEPYLWYVPGFEWIGPGGCCRSADYARALRFLHEHALRAALGAHFQPERATGASYGGSGRQADTPRGYLWHDYQDPAAPGLGAFIEDDDPWGGCEPCFWQEHGGEYLDALLYQQPHGRKLIDGAEWEERWIEIVDRLGAGLRGWRRVGVSLFENTGYDFYHGRATTDDAVRIATRAQDLCAARGVICTFGDGLPASSTTAREQARHP